MAGAGGVQNAQHPIYFIGQANSPVANFGDYLLPSPKLHPLPFKLKQEIHIVLKVTLHLGQVNPKEMTD